MSFFRLRVSKDERRRLWVLQGWVVAVGIQVLVVAAHLYPVDLDRTATTALALFMAALLAQTLTAHLAFFVLLVAGLAAWGRRWKLLIAACPLSIWLLVVWTGMLWPATPPSPVGPALKVMSVNLLMVNRNHAPIVAEIRREDPDLICFQEYTEHWHSALRKGLGGRYPHREFICRSDSFGLAIWSKRPLLDVERRLPADGAPPQALHSMQLPAFRAEVEQGGRRWAVYNIHLLPPRRLDYVLDQRAQFRALVGRLQADSLPVLLTGDFNWNQYTWYHRRLKRLGLAEGHAQAGWGGGGTWPASGRLCYLPGLRLDHIYLRGLVCLAHRTGAALGSDHRALIARVAEAE